MSSESDVFHEGKEIDPVSRRTEAARSKKVLKRILTVFILAAVVFAGVSLFWYGFKYLPYRNAAGKMQLNGNPEMPRYMAVSRDHLFKIKMPSFLSFESGFLYVGPADEQAAAFEVDEDGGLIEKNVPHVDMFIWPKIFSGAEYGITLYEENYSRQIMVDSSGAFLSGVDSLSEAEVNELRELYEKHKDEIREVISAAKDFWGDDLP